ncbi:H-NS histone family protein [Burkholderia sp. BCC1977]|uniref:H-NS histone family protein n=1 Tax=Burkholderia sp. BCC1977 TaxID=2817440 RepID=UPI002ABD609E|nr:H-NS histone family protein [Burkholderia sp. BCC1977]
MTTYDEIQAQIEHLQQQAAELKKREKTDAITDMKRKIAKYGITAADLGLTAKSGGAGGKPPSTKSAGPAKYRQPDTGETWTGRGPKPKWLVDEIATGKKKEDFLIDRSADQLTPQAA